METDFNLDSLEAAVRKVHELEKENAQAKKEFEELLAKLEKDYGTLLDKKD